MANYNDYVSGESRLRGEVDIDAPDDALAMSVAERMLADAKCDVLEVWHGTRLVGSTPAAWADAADGRPY